MVHRVPRYQVVAPIRYRTASYVSAERTGWTRDVSEQGACVELAEHLASGTQLAVVVETEAGPIRMAGTVVWAGAGDSAGPRYLHGLRFSSGSDDRDRLWAWLQRHPAPPARIAASLPVRTRRLDGVTPEIAGWTADLGGGGCTLFLPERLPVGALLDVALSTPCGDVPSEGIIVWEGSHATVSAGLLEHGFRFTKLGPDQEAVLGEVLETILATRAEPRATVEQPQSSATT